MPKFFNQILPNGQVVKQTIEKHASLETYIPEEAIMFVQSKKNSIEQWEGTRIQNTVKLCPLKILLVLQYITKLCKEAVISP